MPVEPPLPAWRRRAVVLSWAAGGAVFLGVVNSHYPVGQWLFWIYLRVILQALLMAGACLSIGHLALTRALRLTPPLRERYFMSFALGVLIFGLGIFLLGIAHLLGGVVFWLWPLACAAAGASGLVHHLSRVHRRLRAARSLAPSAGTSPARRARWGSVAVGAFGVAGGLLLYLNILTPRNAGFDAHWYHYALAEHYAAAGGIARFPEGFFGGAFPHLASWLYTWAFLSPGGLFFHMELAAHVEFVVFVATLAGVPVLVRWMLHGRRAPGTWAALFLFPGIFLYDSSLSGLADHVLAFWALALLLAFRRVLFAFDPRRAILFACMAAGAALTKHQAINVLAFPALALLIGGVGAAVAAARHRKSRRVRVVLTSLALMASVFAAVTSPHWLKNLLWYGDPVYPHLRGALHAHPWAPGATTGFRLDDWRPTGSLRSALASALRAVVTFSFVPNDWRNFHGAVPVFGSLFTLALPSLLFFRGMRRTQLVAAAALVGVFVWFLTLHQDRYLQALLPWMAAVVAAVLIRCWDGGRFVRASVAAVVALQIVWGGDVYTIPTHTGFRHQAPIQAAVELLSTGYRRDWGGRFQTGSALQELAPLLPLGSKVLIHETELRLGTGRMAVSDARGVQGAIDYSGLVTPRAVWDLLRAFGVTHVIWRPGSVRADQRLSDEVVFSNFVTRFTSDETVKGGLHLARLPDRAPPSQILSVAVLACEQELGSSIAELDALASAAETGHRLSGLATTAPPPPPPPSPDVWLLQKSCPLAHPRGLPAGYREAGDLRSFVIGTKQ